MKLISDSRFPISDWRRHPSTARKLPLVILAMAVFGAPLAGEAQQTGKVYRIGYLGNVPTPPPLWEAFLRGLREHGWVEGQNLVIELRNAEGRFERLPDLAADLVRLRVDIIVAAGSPAPIAAKRATNTIPIVMTNAGDPVGSGLVTSLGRPGGNVTGLSLLAPALVGKQLELLKEVVPKVNRAAILTNPGHPARALMLTEAEAAMRPLGL